MIGKHKMIIRKHRGMVCTKHEERSKVLSTLPKTTLLKFRAPICKICSKMQQSKVEMGRVYGTDISNCSIFRVKGLIS